MTYYVWVTTSLTYSIERLAIAPCVPGPPYERYTFVESKWPMPYIDTGTGGPRSYHK